MSESAAQEIPMSRRQLLSFVTGGAIAATTAATLYPVVLYFLPPSTAGGGEGVAAKDKEGKDISVSKLLAAVTPGERVLTLGLDVNGGDATYIVINDQKEVANFGINAVCTHLGCVVPWDNGAKQFKCPCHGSVYNADGGLERGPAPQPLALVKTTVSEDKVLIAPWTEQDFRCTDLWCNKDPYWAK
ncbi:cytochrome b6-f complex iron-sulfur subunit [Gloeobacter morelensis]|uniref:Cytochrome b6-f complex iron-sulfur subunit n=1 Tax=Gloeobacter morelensis MG652769 TaxID=2781736 RepID=A0ABY3PNL6_9CYAN|nr:cytochrome b6-f complex iron-sulfur subunit [Gloeobacter morelensis]UFP95262.1 cytochrome b6-f complex iron-sulfur subunit [Gloeobacter morelensis MG652769]